LIFEWTIIYGDRTIIGFVGFVANLLNRPIAGATVSFPKKSYFSSACEYVKLPFSLRVPKEIILDALFYLKNELLSFSFSLNESRQLEWLERKISCRLCLLEMITN
jgi:hypothetical protein